MPNGCSSRNPSVFVRSIVCSVLLFLDMPETCLTKCQYGRTPYGCSLQLGDRRNCQVAPSWNLGSFQFPFAFSWRCVYTVNSEHFLSIKPHFNRCLVSLLLWQVLFRYLFGNIVLLNIAHKLVLHHTSNHTIGTVPYNITAVVGSISLLDLCAKLTACSFSSSAPPYHVRAKDRSHCLALS